MSAERIRAIIWLVFLIAYAIVLIFIRLLYKGNADEEGIGQITFWLRSEYTAKKGSTLFLVLLLAFFAIQSWYSDVKETEQESYEKGYEVGFEEGYDEGDSAEETAYEIGYEDGVESVDTDEEYEDGYSDGYDEGYSDALNGY